MTIKRRMLGAFLAILLVFTTANAPLARAAEDKKTAAVDEVFADLSKSGSPGCALGVYRDGKILYARGYGLANLEENVSITPQSVFDIGSTSKQFTATSILLLQAQGKLSINDDIRKYLPEIPDYGQKITILHLLNHTSGLRDYLTLMYLAGINIDSVTTDDDALQIVARQKALNFEPGSEWLYSNTGFFLLSIIAKRASGKTLREFAAENIFTPLGMTHTQFRDDHTLLIPNRAMAYDAKESGTGYALDVSYFEQTGDGAVHTSVEDLQKWDENFFSAHVGGKEFLSSLQQPGKLNSGKLLDYAKGLEIGEYRGLATVRHGGSWGGYRSELLRFPAQHFSVACLCNLGTANPEERAEHVADVYLGSLMKPKENRKIESGEEKAQKAEIQLTKEQLQGYQGDYFSDELETVYRLGLVEGKLGLSVREQPGSFSTLTMGEKGKLRATGRDEFELGTTRVMLHFRRGDDHSVTGFILDAGRTRGLYFGRAEPGHM